MKPSNLLQIESLTENWCDKDVVILHACFQLLKDFVEKEKEIIEQIDWEDTKGKKEAKKEIDLLYNWWLERSQRENDLDQNQYDEDNQMLKRLIDVRQHLWS